MKHTKNNTQLGFTLIELIVVITILAILGTIGFVTMTGYFAGTRDSSRVTDMNNIYEQLNLSLGTNGSLPLPDNFVTTTSSGNVVTYQGYAGKGVLAGIKFEKGGRDPKDDTYYTYTINKKKSQAQLMGYFEEFDTTKLTSKAEIIPGISQASAAALTDYSDRKIGILGKMLGTLVASGTLVPLQDTSTGTIDLTTSTGYTAYFSNTVASTGSLSTAFQNNSIVYTAIAPENGVCGSSNASFSMVTPTSNLCSTGTPTTATGSGPWTWNCTGGGTGSTASCSALTYASVFATGSIYTSNWVSNTCNPASITVDTTTFLGGTQYMTQTNLAANKVYVVPNGTYVLTGALGASGHFYFQGTCTALIGESRDGVVFSGAMTSGGYNVNAPLVYAYRNGAILANFTAIPGSGATNEYGMGVINGGANTSMQNIKITNARSVGLQSQSSDSTLSGITINGAQNGAAIYADNSNFLVNNLSITNAWNIGVTLYQVRATDVTATLIPGHGAFANNIYVVGNGGVYKNFNVTDGTNGLFIADGANDNTFENFTIRNSNRGVLLRGGRNVFKNMEVYNTNEWGILVDSSNAFNNAFNNLRVYNVGGGDGIYFEQGSRNTFSNVSVFNNERTAFRVNPQFGPIPQTVLHNALLANSGTGWLAIGNSGTGSIFADVTIHNITTGYDNGNNSYGPLARFYGQFKVLGSTYQAPTAGYFATGSSADFPSASLTNGSIFSGALSDCTLHPQPNLVASWGTNCLSLGALPITTNPVTSFNFGSNMPNQVQPLRWNYTSGVLERYGVDGVDYDSTKKIGQW